MKDQKATIIYGPDFESLFARGVSGTTYNPNECPPGGFTVNDQIRYTPWGIQSRPGTETFTPFVTISAPDKIVQILPYHTNSPSAGTVINGYFLVVQTSTGTDIYDSNAAVPATRIAATTATAWVSFIVLFNRIAFTFHDFSTGVVDNFPWYYVYQPGAATARFNGGTSPSLAGVGIASSGTAGFVTQGVHVFGLAYETDTGHITAIIDTPGVDVNFFTLANANEQVTVTGLPVIAAPYTKVHILMSRLVVNSSGNPSDYELFFAAEYTGATTTITFNITDEALVDSADYLYDLLIQATYPLGFTWYANRMITWGEGYSPVNQAFIGPSVLRVSESGKPESFSISSGVVPVFQDDGDSGVKSCWEYKGLLIIQKESRTFVTRDNGDEPNTWQVDILDGTIGSVLFGIAKTNNQVGAIRTDYTICVSRNGVYLFDGKFNEIPLTWKIERLWQQISETTQYLTYQLIDIPTAKLLIFKVWYEGCSGSVTGIIGDGGSEGWAWLCSETNGTTEVQADVNGNFTIEDVPCGTYTLYFRDDAGTLYGVLADTTVTSGVETDVGTVELTEEGTAPTCPATPTNASYPYLLVCDYSKGLAYQTVRWSKWFFSDSEINNDPVWLAMEDRNNMRMVVNDSVTILNMIIGTEDTEIAPVFLNGEILTGELNPDEEMNLYHWLQVRLRGVFTKVTNCNWLFGSTTNALLLPQTSVESDVTRIIVNQKSFFPQFQMIFTAAGDTTTDLKIKQIAYFHSKNAEDLLGQ